MNYLTKTNFLIVLVFLLVVSFVYKTTTDTLTAYQSSAYTNNLNILEGNYRMSLDLYEVIADNLYNTIIAQESTLSLLDNAKNTDSSLQRSELRKQLYKTLQPYYEHLHKNGLNIILFSFENNHVFLRVHKPSKHSDDISSVRKMIVNVNENKEIVRGFEQGKISHAFRNIYPLYYKGKYLGSVDISFSSESLQKHISEIYGVYTHFLVKKSVFDTTQWSHSRNVNYTQSVEHKDYLYTLSTLDNNQTKSSLYNQLAQLAHEAIEQGINEQQKFATSVDKDGTSYILSFKPIRKYKSSEVLAYIVSYTQNHDLYIVKRSYYLVNIGLFFILLLLALTLLYVMRKKDSLKEEVKLQTITIEKKKQKLEKTLKAFDKNVIYSRTDLQGFITHVSEAFCKISGYTEEELRGKPHNIVRHPDMPKETFKEMWEALKQNGFWNGDIKNKRKDGTYYWVHSKVERDYNDLGNAIGYYAVREDITDKKEVEELKAELEEFNRDLETQVKERTQEIIALNHEIQETQREVVFTMGAIGESRSQETGNHVKRVAEYSKLLALYYGVDEENAETLKQASPMHDIGKVAIPDAVLNKPGRFNDEERKVMDEHARLGYEMLKHSSRPLLKMAATIAYEHHEKWDGTGYPNKLAGEKISIYGRITALADVFDALGSDRVYKKAWELERILELFKEERGKHFDPKLIDIFLENLDKFLEIRDRLKN
ncbi:MAG: HD domain-containing protein [Campylobacterales bacterium]|nr:HD domain-containing protein [Campylobacterales bacterium]